MNEGQHRMPEPITFTRHDDGAITADRWPSTIAVTDELRDEAGGVITWASPTLRVCVANGWASYEFAHALKNTPGVGVYYLTTSEFGA